MTLWKIHLKFLRNTFGKRGTHSFEFSKFGIIKFYLHSSIFINTKKIICDVPEKVVCWREKLQLFVAYQIFSPTFNHSNLKNKIKLIRICCFPDKKSYPQYNIHSNTPAAPTNSSCCFDCCCCCDDRRLLNKMDLAFEEYFYTSECHRSSK